jgi:hypothetical protein
MMKTAMSTLLFALGLVTCLALSSSAAEAAANCPLSVTAPAVPAGAPDMEKSLATIFGKAPAPKPASGTVDCGQCPGGTHGPEFQCTRQCRSYGLCPDQCYADADTCQLSDCICLLC